jgi:NADH:ubiquinone oxidoreductase subunit 2 (subunit N)
MYMRDPKQEVVLTKSFANGVALAITTVAVLLIGVFPTVVLSLARAAIKGF